VPRLLPCSLAVAALVLGAAPRAVAGPRVAVLRIDFEPVGKVPAASRLFLSERLVEGLANAGFAVSLGDVLRNAQDRLPSPQNCRSQDCYRQIAGRLGLDYLVIANLTVKEKNYDLRLQLVSGLDGRPAVDDARARCDLCGIQEVGQKLDKLASSLLSSALEARKVPAPARITVQSEPSGASVTIDGRSAGEAPLWVDLSPGSHEVAVAAGGYAPAHRKINVDAGVRGLVSIGLIPIASAPGGGQVRGRHLLALGWAALALGAAAVGTGIGVFTIDGQQVSCPSGKTDPCRRNTRMAAGALIGAGGAAMAAGTFFLYLGWGSLSPPPETMLASGWSLSVGGKF
jgi:PEGA domain